MNNTMLAILNQICEVTYYVMYSYDALINLEIKGMKNSPQFKAELFKLRTLIDKETILYAILKSNDNWAALSFSFLIKNTPFEYENNVISAITQNENELMQRRIFLKLLIIILENPLFFKESIDESYANTIINEKQGVSYLYEITPILEKTFDFKMNYLMHRLTNEAKEKDRIHLIKAKYYQIFLSSELESESISNGFNPSSCNLTQELETITSKVHHKTKEEVIDLHGMGIVLLALTNLLEINGTIPDNKNTSIYASMLKCGLTFLSAKNIKVIKELANEIVNDHDYQTRVNTDELKKILTNAFNTYEELNIEENKNKRKYFFN